MAGQFVFVVLAEGLTIAAVGGWLQHYRTTFSAIGLLRPRARDFGYGLLALVPYYFLYAVLLSLGPQAPWWAGSC